MIKNTNFSKALKVLEKEWKTQRLMNPYEPINPSAYSSLVKDIVLESQRSEKLSLLIIPLPYSEMPEKYRTSVYDMCKDLKHDLNNETAYLKDDASYYEYVIKPLTEELVSTYIKICISKGYTCPDEMIEDINRYDVRSDITFIDSDRVHFEIMK